MNYKRIHDEIIENALSRNLDLEAVTESHHIIPKCMGGTDDVANLVKLTPREHLIIHVLLFKIYKTGKLAYAVTAMGMSNSGQRRPSSRHTANARAAAAKYYSDNYSGVNHNWYGKKHTEETKLKMRLSATGVKKDPVGVEKTAESKRKRVIATCLQTGAEYTFVGMRKAVEEGYASHHNAISKVCRGLQNTHNGYTWRLAGRS